MQDFASAFDLAFRLVFSADPDLVEIILLSLRVSLSAVGVALVLGLPLGATVAIGRFPGRTVLIVLFNALMGLPPVVVGGATVISAPPASRLQQAVFPPQAGQIGAAVLDNCRPGVGAQRPPARQPVDDDTVKRCMSFLRNHKEAIAAMDFFAELCSSCTRL